MEIKEVKPSPPRSRQMLRIYQFKRWSIVWTLICFLMNIHIGRQRGYTTPWFYSKCSPSSCSYGEKGGRTNDPLRLLAWPSAFRPAGRHLCCPISWDPCTSREEIRDLYYQVYKLRRLPRSLAMWTGMGRWIKEGCSVLLEKLPEVERGWATKGSSGDSPNRKTEPRGERLEALQPKPSLPKWREAHWRVPGNHHHFGRKDRVAEPVPN